MTPKVGEVYLLDFLATQRKVRSGGSNGLRFISFHPRVLHAGLQAFDSICRYNTKRNFAPAHAD